MKLNLFVLGRQLELIGPTQHRTIVDIMSDDSGNHWGVVGEIKTNLKLIFWKSSQISDLGSDEVGGGGVNSVLGLICVTIFTFFFFQNKNFGVSILYFFFHIFVDFVCLARCAYIGVSWFRVVARSRCSPYH